MSGPQSELISKAYSDLFEKELTGVLQKKPVSKLPGIHCVC